MGAFGAGVAMPGTFDSGAALSDEIRYQFVQRCELQLRLVYDLSQNLGSLSPGTKMRSTPSLSIIASLIVPPEDPSRDIASARAAARGASQLHVPSSDSSMPGSSLTIPDEVNGLLLVPTLLVSRVAVSVDVRRPRSCAAQARAPSQHQLRQLTRSENGCAHLRLPRVP